MSLTPELCRASRALLAWSQRRLAEEAHTAISTVADFERGARSPIANSVEAFTNALENGGVRFTGGVASLVATSTPESALADGQPFGFIRSHDLLEWAGRFDGRSGLPELIDRLVLAGAGPNTIRHFPAGESTQAGGWDGTCESPRAVANRVPIGKSGWELTVNGSIDKKADGDFKKREETLDHATRLHALSSTSFAVAPTAGSSKVTLVSKPFAVQRVVASDSAERSFAYTLRRRRVPGWTRARPGHARIKSTQR